VRPFMHTEPVSSARAAAEDPAGSLGASTVRDSREEEDWTREGPHASETRAGVTATDKGSHPSTSTGASAST
jgi:hypothetical protein